MNTQIQKQNFTVTTALQYVDPRDGNRPASIKGSNGDRYTISDAGYQQYSQMQGQECELTYYEKPSTNPDYPPFSRNLLRPRRVLPTATCRLAYAVSSSRLSKAG